MDSSDASVERGLFGVVEVADQHSKLLSWKNKWHLHCISTRTSGPCSLMMGPMVESASPLAVSDLTCFGKVFPVVTEILEEGDTLTPRVVPP